MLCCRNVEDCYTIEIAHAITEHPTTYSSVLLIVDKFFAVVAQGLNWYTSRLKEDRDGDIADEFLEEPQAEASRSQSAPPTDPALTPLQVGASFLP